MGCLKSRVVRNQEQEYESIYEPPATIEFSLLDANECRESITSLQDWYASSYPNYIEEERQINNMKSKLFSTKTD